jgi:hypothetical protein
VLAICPTRDGTDFTEFLTAILEMKRGQDNRTDGRTEGRHKNKSQNQTKSRMK